MPLVVFQRFTEYEDVIQIHEDKVVDFPLKHAIDQPLKGAEGDTAAEHGPPARVMPPGIWVPTPDAQHGRGYCKPRTAPLPGTGGSISHGTLGKQAPWS